MRKLKVRHEPLPGIGEVFELQTAAGAIMTVVVHRSGRRDVVVGAPDGDGDPARSATLTRAEAAAVAALLTGAHIELTTTARS